MVAYRKINIAVACNPVHIAKKTRRKAVVGIGIDVSHSMYGEKLEQSIECYGDCLDNFKPKDQVALFTYGSEVSKLHDVMPVQKINKAKDKENIRKSSGGCTAFYDSLILSVNSLGTKLRNKDFRNVTKDAHFQVIMISDGEDNRSKATLQEAANLVANPGVPNFHLVVVGIQMEQSTRETLKGVLCAKTRSRIRNE